MTTPRLRQLLLWCSLLAFSSLASSQQASPAAIPDYAAAIANPTRSDDDRDTDETRKPLTFLQFTKVRPGMQAMDIASGDGYTAKLLALVVGPTGTVWAQLDKPRPRLDNRLKAQPQANLRPYVRPVEDPYPADAPRLDLITLVLSYHDIAYQPVDRALMARNLFKALKRGGYFVVIDHSAKVGTGITDSKTLHRIDQATVVADFKAAGFKLDEESQFLRNPADPREQAFFDAKITTDKFALRFVKP
ncbi:MAG: class I SAM-dependent methyltransferase [Burkholderiales bacterium]